jgi:hypothetical protein
MTITIQRLVELEAERLDLDCEIEYDYQPGEPMVRYYPDGSGYPGCEPAIDPTSVTITGIRDWEGGEIERSEKPEEFTLLEQFELQLAKGGDYDDEVIDKLAAQNEPFDYA